MKAVVMAGGEGSRLRPLTSGIPKPLVPVVGKPVMEHILRLLRKHGITDVVVTLQYLGSAIRDYFGDGSDFGVDITYVVEDSPLGTAGSVKNAQEFLDEPFIVISGDALTDIDLGAVMRYHQEKGAAATIVLTSVPNPLEFGVVITNPDGTIKRFLEKPSWGEVFSDQVNTGIYIIEPKVLDMMPPATVVDWSSDVFPKMLANAMPLYGHLVPGYWCDIGNIQTYYQANWDALEGRVDVEISGERRHGNVWIGEGSTIDAGVKIWPDKEIEPGSTVHESIIWAGHYKRGLFSSYGINGLVNIELTPEYCARLGASFANLYPKGSAIGAARDGQRPSRMIKRAMIAGMMSSGASIIDLSELPIPVVQFYAREHPVAGAVHIQMSPLDSRSADIRLFDSKGVILDKKAERKLENVFFREDIRRVHFYEMGDITYAQDAVDSYIDGLIALIDVETVRRAHLKVLIDFDHGSASLVLPRLFKELNIEAIPLNAGFDETYQSKTKEAFDEARRQSALITRTLGCQLGAYIDYGSERIYLIDEQGGVLDHHEALGVIAMLVLKAKPGVLIAPATVPQTIGALVRQLPASNFVPGKGEPSALFRAAQQHQARLASDGSGGYVFPDHLLGFDAIFTLIKLLELLAGDGRAVSAIRKEIPRAAYEHREEVVPWDAKGRVMRTMVELHRDEPVDLADGIKVFVDGGWVLVLPDPDMPRYHIIVSMEDSEKARALADRYSAMVKTAVSGDSGTPAATR